MDGSRDSMLRLPPHSIEAEQAVVGGLLLHPASFAKVGDWLKPEDFYRRDHELIYRGIAWLIERNKPVDSVTLGEWFEAQGIAEDVGGIVYILELERTTPSAANIEAYAEIVSEKSRLRQAIDAANALIDAAMRPGVKASTDVVGEAQLRLSGLQGAGRAGGLLPVKSLIGAWHTGLQNRHCAKQLPGLPTPWAVLNKLTHGIQGCTVVAGRSNMGKSIFGGQLGAFSALRGTPTAFFSLEMSANQVIQRGIAQLQQIPHDWLMEPDEANWWPDVTQGVLALGAAPLYIDDSPRLNARQIVARAKRQHMRQKLGLIVVDHLHEMALDGRQREDIELGNALRDLKALGKELGVPMLVLAQLNRGSDRENGRRPRMTDLKGSGGIEEVADTILLLHREDVYRPDTNMKGIVEVILGKGRDIKSGSVVLLTDRYECMRIDDREGGPPPELPMHDRDDVRARQVGFDA